MKFCGLNRHPSQSRKPLCATILEIIIFIPKFGIIIYFLIIMANMLKNKSICIEKILFDIPGKITLKLEDGRIIITPLKYFPEIQKLSVDKRKKYTIVDDRTILFSYSDSVYHLEDFIGLENNWRQR